jgi:hypothetical protein
MRERLGNGRVREARVLRDGLIASLDRALDRRAGIDASPDLDPGAAAITTTNAAPRATRSLCLFAVFSST